MCAIYKKELRAYLTSMTGYIFMTVLLAVTSLYYVANCLVGGYSVFGAVLSSVYFVLLIIVPVLTMRSMAGGKTPEDRPAPDDSAGFPSGKLCWANTWPW